MKHFLKLRGSIRTIVVAAAVAVVFGSSFAVASSLITSKNIKNGTIKPADLNKKLQKKINKRTTAAAAIPGQQGPNGAEGKQGPEGKTGPAGTPAAVGLSTCGPMPRNEFGSPVAETGTTAMGVNALILGTASGAEKAEYGSEVEFKGLKISSIIQIGFNVYVTDEDLAFGTYQPNIQMEVDPKVPAGTFSSLVYQPPISQLKLDQFSGYIDATQTPVNTGQDGWYFAKTAVASATGCTQAHLCSLAEVKTAAPNAEVTNSLGLGKGRDSQFEGAISEFKLNGAVYTFGPGGTFKK